MTLSRFIVVCGEEEWRSKNHPTRVKEEADHAKPLLDPASHIQLTPDHESSRSHANLIVVGAIVSEP